MNTLVLEGGGMRAIFSAAVLDVFIQQQLEFKNIVAVSAGALFGVNLPSKQPGRALRYNKRFLNDHRYMGLCSLLTTGNIVNKDFCFYEVPMHLDPFDEAAFEAANCQFYVVTTNVQTGAPEYFLINNVFEQMELFRATSAMPFVSKMVPWEGQLYLDGGISDSIPFAFANTLGAEKMVVVLTRDIHYHKKPMAPWLIKCLCRHYPALAEKLMKRHSVYNQQIEALHHLEEAGKVFVIRPSEPLKIGRLEKNWNNVQAVYDAGLAEGRRQMPALLDYLKQ